MLRIVAYERKGQVHTLRVANHPEYGEIPLALHDGNLESYMGAYGLQAGEALTMILVDGLVDGIDAPPFDAPDLAEKLAALKEAAKGQLRWEIDRNEVLSSITLAEDQAADMVNSWAAYAEAYNSVPVATIAEVRAEEAERRASYAAGVRRREEELLAEEIVSSMDTELLRAPKAEPSAPMGEQPVGLAIQFV